MTPESKKYLHLLTLLFYILASSATIFYCEDSTIIKTIGGVVLGISIIATIPVLKSKFNGSKENCRCL